jgi:hypothetical protein
MFFSNAVKKYAIVEIFHNDDLANAEWGYISFSELAYISVCGVKIDRDV